MDAFKAAFRFLLKGALKEVSTPAGRVNMVVVVLFIVGSFGAETVHTFSSAVVSIFGHDSSEFPLVAVLIIICAFSMFCVGLLFAGEIVREAAGSTSRSGKKKND